MADEARAIGFSVQITLDDKRTIVAQTHLGQDESQAAVDKVLDKITASVERQKKRFLLNDLKRWFPTKQKKLEEQRKLLTVVDARHQAEWTRQGKKGAFKLDPKQEGERNTVFSGIDRYIEEIAIDEAEIAALEKELGDGA